MAGFCANCGAELMDSAAFCPKCGKATAVSAPTSGTAAATSSSTPPVRGQSVTSSGLDDNIAGLLAYLFIPAIVFLLLEPYNRNRFVRFHSFQAIALAVISIAVHTILGLSLIGVVLLIPFNIFWIVLIVICMIKAFQMQMFRLPIVGEFAEKQAGR